MTLESDILMVIYQETTTTTLSLSGTLIALKSFNNTHLYYQKTLILLIQLLCPVV